MRNPGLQQEIVTTYITVGDGALVPVDTNDYTINYYSILTCGNTADTITVTLNGVPDVVLSMVGLVEMPIQSIEVTSVQDTSGAGVTKGLIVYGLKVYKTMW
jgi:hypothetical protein